MFNKNQITVRFGFMAVAAGGAISLNNIRKSLLEIGEGGRAASAMLHSYIFLLRKLMNCISE